MVSSRHKRRAVVLTSAVASSLLGDVVVTAASSPASAAIACVSAHGSYFDGYEDTAAYGRYDAIDSKLTVRFSQVCDGDTSNSHNEVSAWTMLYDSSDGNGWAQTGYERGYGGTLTDFSQTWTGNAGATPNTKFFGARTDGEQHDYKQAYDTGCACIKGYVDSTQLYATSWNPYSTWGDYPSTEAFGEVNYTGSQMPGTVNYKGAFSNTQSRRNYDGVWEHPPMKGFDQNTAAWGLSAYDQSSGNFVIWEK